MTTSGKRSSKGVKPQRLPRGMRQPALMSAPAKADLAFLEYHHANPQVYATFKRIALRLYERGIRHYGAKCIMEVVRYETAVSAATENDPLKINNNFTSRYARLLAAEDARFKDFFEFRVLRSEKGAA